MPAASENRKDIQHVFLCSGLIQRDADMVSAGIMEIDPPGFCGMPRIAAAVMRLFKLEGIEINIHSDWDSPVASSS